MRKQRTNSTESKAANKWEAMARQDLPHESLAVFYERSGKYQYSAGMSQEDADRRAFMEVVKNER